MKEARQIRQPRPQSQFEHGAVAARPAEGALADGLESYVYVMLGMDARLRRGEALGLHCGRACWEAGESRHESGSDCLRGPSARPEEPGSLTKSGRDRRVALSSRLHGALRALYRLREEPPTDQLVIRTGVHRREWARIVKRAGIGHRRYKDLRDTFASQLARLPAAGPRGRPDRREVPAGYIWPRRWSLRPASTSEPVGARTLDAPISRN